MFMNEKLRECVIAFMDILGFKWLWRNNQALTIRALNEIKQEISGSPHFPDIRMSIRSDSIYIWAIIDHSCSEKDFVDRVTNLFARINSFIFYHLQQGILFRGAVSFGEVYFDDEENIHIIAGEPLNEAAENEKNLADLPRIIVLPPLIRKMESLSYPHRYCVFSQFCEMDFDGLYIVNTMRGVFDTKSCPEETYRIILNIRGVIDEQLLANQNNLTVLRKWRWLAQYFDSSIGSWNNNNPEKIIQKLDISNPPLRMSEQELDIFTKTEKVQ